MKKTHDANIGGMVFHVDDVAYDQLEHYLNSIKSYFAAYPDHVEILADIEGRIAEQLLQVTPQRIVTEANVQHIITVMGRVEQFGDTGDTKDTGGTDAPVPAMPAGDGAGIGIRSKRFFRDRDEKVIAGVAGGLAAYFGQSPLAMRLLFLASLFIGGIGIWLYLILWVCVPYARTTTDKLRMHGEQVTLATIEQGIRDRVNVMPLDQRQRLRRVLPFGIAAAVILFMCICGFLTCNHVAFNTFTVDDTFSIDTDDPQGSRLSRVRRVDTVIAVQGVPATVKE